MNKQQTSDSLPIWIILVILFIAVVTIYFFFRDESINRYKRDLSQRIKKKEDTINFLRHELLVLRNMHNTLKSEAVKLYKFIKVMAMILLLVAGIICYAVLKMEYWSAVFLIVSIITFVYYSATIIVQNKIGDFNRTLELIQDYLIQRKFKKAGFNPSMIEFIEVRLYKEEEELIDIRRQYLLIENNNRQVKMAVKN